MLVVDDDPDILQTLGLCLSSEGYRVLMAANGKEALDILDREHPSVILLDLMMPVMDGFQSLDELPNTRAGSVPVVVLTASELRAPPASVLRTFKKPIPLDLLLRIVAEQCDR